MFDFPASPSNGQTVTGASGAVYTFDGTKWRAGGTSSRASLTIGDTPPASPLAGELWWDSTGGQLFVWYADPNTSQWVLANSGPIASDAPNDARTYARQSRAWTDITATAAASPNNVGRNLLHNPLMAVAQRGTGPWSATGYTLDRWVLAVTSDTTTLSTGAISDAARAQIGDEAAAQYLGMNVTGNAAAGASTSIQQGMEGVRRLAGKTITLSFWAAASAALKIGASLDQYFGSGGSPSATVTGTGQAVTVSTAWARYSVTIAVPSISGKTLGTNGNDATWLSIWFSSGSTNATRSGNVGVQTGTFTLWGIQLEIGSVATPLDYGGSYADQLRACQRYYQVGGLQLNAYAGAVGSFVLTSMLPVVMRGNPTFALIGSPTYVNSSSANFTGSPSNVQLNFTSSAAGSTACVASFTASADL